LLGLALEWFLSFVEMRLSFFAPSLALLVCGFLAASFVQLNDFFLSLFNVLPTLLMLLGGAFCAAYGRQRELFLLITIYLLYFQLDTQTDFYVLHGKPSADAGLVFNLCTFLLPVLYSLYALWQERTHLFQDLLARVAVLVLVLGVTAALVNSYPDSVAEWLYKVRWPSLYVPWLRLIQLAYPLFFIGLLLLAIQYFRNPRPLHAAQFIGLVALLWMLPDVFILKHALHVMSSMTMLILVTAVAHEAYQMAFHDELTGLPGRRALNERLLRLGRQYVIAMTDVDHFKRFNDTHGHDVGDQVLRVVASQLRKVGGGGRAYRYGGEEFVVVFPGKTLDACLPHLEELREGIEAYVLKLRDQDKRPKDDQIGRQSRKRQGARNVSVTISIGVAERQVAQRTSDEVLKAADKALYSAKSAGRNCVRVDGYSRSGAVRVRGA